MSACALQQRATQVLYQHISMEQPHISHTPNTVLYVKNMVCDRCKAAVSQACAAIGVQPLRVELGEIIFSHALAEATKRDLGTRLRELGFELLERPNEQAANRIKTLIIKFVRRRDTRRNVNLSNFLEDEMNADYGTLSKLFSSTTGSTIGKYHIAQKIELTKELLSYGELSLGEIAFRLDYSSTAYLSTQFKEITGMTPTQYRSHCVNMRKALDRVD